VDDAMAVAGDLDAITLPDEAAWDALRAKYLLY